MKLPDTEQKPPWIAGGGLGRTAIILLGIVLIYILAVFFAMGFLLITGGASS